MKQDSPLRPIDDRVIETLVGQHKKFRAFLARRVESDEVAEDLLQLSLRKALETPARVQEEASVVAWFYAILRNVLVDFYRARARESDANEAYLQELTLLEEDHAKARHELEATVCECMKGLLPTLKPEYTAILERVDLQGRSIREVAKDLGVTENNLTVRLHRARRALRRSLERACGTCTEHGCLDCTCG